MSPSQPLLAAVAGSPLILSWEDDEPTVIHRPGEAHSFVRETTKEVAVRALKSAVPEPCRFADGSRPEYHPVSIHDQPTIRPGVDSRTDIGFLNTQCDSPPTEREGTLILTPEAVEAAARVQSFPTALDPTPPPAETPPPATSPELESLFALPPARTAEVNRRAPSRAQKFARGLLALLVSGLLGFAATALAFPRGARRTYNMILNPQPGPPSILSATAVPDDEGERANSQARPADREQIHSLTTRAARALAQGDVDRAANLYQRAAALAPGDHALATMQRILADRESGR